VDSNGLNSSNSTSNWISVRFGENCFDFRWLPILWWPKSQLKTGKKDDKHC
jgi:hypothetical protein